MKTTSHTKQGTRKDAGTVTIQYRAWGTRELIGESTESLASFKKLEADAKAQGTTWRKILRRVIKDVSAELLAERQSALA
ncbi:MAG: hypothetical protein WCS31_06170 [Verrucomicrobiae bacterium]